jgi:uncharacterized protein
VIPRPPPGAVEPVPERPDRRRGPRGTPAVTWSWGEALLLFIVGNVVISQALFGALVYALLRAEPGAGPSGEDVIATLVVDVVFVALLVGWLQTRHQGWPRRLGIGGDRSWVRDAGWGLVAGIVLYPVIAIGVGAPLQALFDLLSELPVTTPDQVPRDLTTAGRALTVVLAVLVAPPTEEFFYRGVLFRSIRDRLGFWPGALLSAVIFGLVHYVPAPWPNAVLLQSVMVFTGLGFAWIYERRGTIVAPIAAHMAFNTIGITIIFATQ